MEANEKPIHVIFGFGPVGKTLAARLVNAGEKVKVVSRSGKTIPGAEAVTANASIPEQARRAAAGATVVYNCSNADYTKWPELLPPLYRSILRAAIQNGAKLVYTDNLYMYGSVPGKMNESLPNAAAGSKGQLRAELADEVRAAHAKGLTKTVILRASDFYGPDVEGAMLGLPALRAMVVGKSVPALGNIDMPHSFTFVPDVAAALEICGRDARADGEIWHAPTAPAVSTREMLNRFGKELGKTPKIMQAKRPMVTLLGLFMPLMRTLKETLYQWEAPYEVDSSKFERAFGVQPTAIDDGIRLTVASFRRG